MTIVARAVLAGAFVSASLFACSQNPSSERTGISAIPAGATVGRADILAYHRTCPEAIPGYAACEALVADAQSHATIPASLPNGYGPADLWSAYNLQGDVGKGGGMTVAIVDAYDNPNLASDMAVYRSTYGLLACSNCLRKVNQNGGSTLPAGNQGWGAEESLDVDMVSAICQHCSILLVEATTSSKSDIEKAVSEARKLKANIISTSFALSEFHGEEVNTPFNAGRPVTASGGSSGNGSYPATSRFVTAVGGTTLTKTASGWNETAWGGGACSAYVPQPPWQQGITPCTKRSDNDVAFVGDPSTGVAVYDTYGLGGWTVFGGTSVGAPAIAGVYALAGNAGSIKNARRIYLHHAALHDIPPAGYDLPTGYGTPNGTGAF